MSNFFTFSKAFYYFWCAQSIGSFASVLYIMTITTYVYHLTRSAATAAAIPLMKVTASLIAGFLSPLIVDKWKLSTFILIGQVAKTLLMMIITALFLLVPQLSVVSLLVMVFIISMFEGGLAPAKTAIVPRLVTSSTLVQANSLLSSTNQSLMVLGYTVGGVFVLKVGTIYAMLITALLYLAASIVYSQCKEPIRDGQQPHHQPSHKQDKWMQLKAGWITIWQYPKLRLITLMDLVEGIANAVWMGAITLVFVNEVLHKDEAWWGYINASYYIGTITGGICITLLSKWVGQRLISSMITGSFLFSLLTLFFGLSTIPWLALVLCILMGPAYQMRDIAQQTIFQQSVEAERLPKALAAKGILTTAAMGLSVYVMGLTADIFGVQKTYILAAGLYSLSVILALVMWRRQKVQQKSQSFNI